MRHHPGMLFAFGVSLTVAACKQDSTSPPPPPPPTPGTHAGYYVVQAPYGSSSGSGSTDNPWDLATALNGGHGNKIRPGDTVWLRGGTFPGSFQTTLDGTPLAPIQFRQYPGERATINGSLHAGGSNLEFWGFEIMQSNPVATNDRVLEANTVNGKFINLVLHDAGISGVSMAADKGEGVELYGSIVYNNGSHDNIDHGIYAHNATAGTKSITDNVFFDNCARGIQIYEGGDSLIRNFQVVGNISFNNGTLSCASSQVNLLISAPAAISGMVARSNLLYFSPGIGDVQLRLGNYDLGDTARYNKDIEVDDNYAAGGSVGLEMQYQWARATVTNNVFIGDGSTDVVHTGGPALSAYTWDGNTYYRDPAARAWEQNGTGYDFDNWKVATGVGGSDLAIAPGPSATRVFLRPNKYEAGRAFIAVYNFARQASVDVNLAGIVTAGSHYEIRNVQNVFGAPVTSGSYAGGAVSIPMNGVQPPAPIGRSTRAPKTGPGFDVFLLTSSAP